MRDHVSRTVEVGPLRADGAANARWSRELEGTWTAVGLNPNLLFNRCELARFDSPPRELAWFDSPPRELAWFDSPSGLSP